MNVELFTLADHASQERGKINVMGAFDSLFASQFPMQHPHCSLALRLRHHRSEDGSHTLRIVMVDADGKTQGFQFDQNIVCKAPPQQDTATINLVIDMNGMPFKHPGDYYWDLVLDGQLIARLPMYVRHVGHQKAAA